MDGKSLDVTAEKIAQLKAIFPEVFSEDKVDFQRLKQALGEDTFAKNEHYELTWAGKSEARKEVQKQTTATLIPDKANSIDFDNTQNIFIEGENLEVLRVLQKSYFGKIKMIYIDPPYNTGNDSFVYPDDYSERQEEYKKRTGLTNNEGFLNKQDLWKKNTKENGQFHSVWLSMMYPRLYLSRNLLKEDGVIFISIDDNEVNNLKLLCNEIFGEENFLATIIWQRAVSPINLKKTFSESHDYVLCYAKNIQLVEILGLKRDNKSLDRYKNPDNDKRGLWTSGGIDVGPVIQDKVYPITTPSGRVVFPPNGYCWRYSKEKLNELILDNRIWFGEKGDNVPRVKRFLSEVKETITPMTLWLREEIGDSQSASRELKKLFEDKSFFEYPKPVGLIKRCIELTTKSGDLILDFFAGSGTTAQAVIELNEEEYANRKFILVQMPEPTEVNSESYNAGFKTIADITKYRIKKVIETYKTKKLKELNFNNNKLSMFNSFILSDSNFNTWKSSVEGKENIAQQLAIFQQSEKKDIKHIDLFVELCLKNGLEINSEFKFEHNFYKTAKSIWFCFERFKVEMKNVLIDEKPPKVIFLNSCFSDDMELTNLQIELKNYNIKLIIV